MMALKEFLLVVLISGGLCQEVQEHNPAGTMAITRKGQAKKVMRHMRPEAPQQLEDWLHAFQRESHWLQDFQTEAAPQSSTMTKQASSPAMANIDSLQSNGNISGLSSMLATNFVGRFKSSGSVPTLLRDAMIPRVVHHIYKYDLTHGGWPNKIWEFSFRSWQRYFPEPWFHHIFWPDVNASEFFRRYCPDHYLVYKNACHNVKCSDCKGAPCSEIVQSDLSRYCILSKLGGIYADLDYEPRVCFYGDFVPEMVNLVQSPYQSEEYQNSLMASQAGHPYWDKVLAKAAISGGTSQGQKTAAGQSKDILSVSGPKLLDSVKETHNQTVVHKLPCNEFQRATHFQNGELQAAKRKHCSVLSINDFKDKRLKGIHWGTLSWLKGSPDTLKLFQDFHRPLSIADFVG